MLVKHDETNGQIGASGTRRVRILNAMRPSCNYEVPHNGLN